MISAALLVALALSAKGEIYRCVGADGSVGFHDKPCKAGKSVLVGSKSDSPQSDLRRLRESLAKLERSEPSPRKAESALNLMPRTLDWKPLGPADEQRLAACSAQFFECAEANAPRMDRCVAALPPCGGARARGCCPQVCLDRYADLRRLGMMPAAAVRNALFDDSYGSCSAR